MNKHIADIMRSAEGRYLTSEEAQTVIDTLRGFEHRLGIMQRLEEKESAIIVATVDKVFEKYPDFPKTHPQAAEKCVRDETLVLRYCALALVNNDPTILCEKLLYWLRTILLAIDFDPGFVRFTYETMQEMTRQNLSAEDAEEINKYLSIVVDVLCSEEQAVAAGQSY